MLDSEALSQLSSLKNQIQASKEYGEGSVSATSGRFGFVRLDDGRDAFLAPEKMDRLLPGDRVKVSLTENDKGKLEATLEELLGTELERFVGQYRVKGKAHFVAPSGIHFNRWIFIPPQQRKGAKEGDFVVARISRHPYSDGKAQAKIVFNIGQADEAYIEHKYVKAKYELNYKLSDKANAQVEALQASVNDDKFDSRKDLRNLDFFTIDSASTLDMDDALAVEQTDSGWELYVAIANPAGYIPPKSALAEACESNAQSVYLLGGTVSMLPANLAHNAFSLVAEQDRATLVCHIKLDKTAAVESFEFQQSVIRSRQKLSYDEVANFIDTQASGEIQENLLASLQSLAELSAARKILRQQQFIVSEDQGDYEYALDKQGKIEAIRLRERNSAHQVVEECMLLCNLCAGDFLQQHSAGLFAIHKGFREDRLGEVKALLKEEAVDHEELNSLEGHVALFQTLSQDSEKSALIPALRRMMQGSEISAEALPHLGMGVPCYATVTSPIRRFVDLYNQWQISNILSEQACSPCSEKRLTALNEQLQTGRQADRELQQWLITQFVANKIGEQARGKIRIVTQQGFGVKIVESGIEGFVLFPKDKEKNFDAKRMSLTVDEKVYRIDDEVEIKIESVDMDKRRIAFCLA